MSDTNDDYVISFKPHGGYDSPLIVVKAKDNQEAADKIDTLTDLAVRVANADVAIKAAFLAAGALGATPVSPAPQAGAAPQGAPAAPQRPAQAPAGPPGQNAPTCPHGTKVWRAAKPGSGKTWKGWFCPSPQGTPDQCAPEFIK